MKKMFIVLTSALLVGSAVYAMEPALAKSDSISLENVSQKARDVVFFSTWDESSNRLDLRDRENGLILGSYVRVSPYVKNGSTWQRVDNGQTLSQARANALDLTVRLIEERMQNQARNLALVLVGAPVDSSDASMEEADQAGENPAAAADQAGEQGSAADMPSQDLIIYEKAIEELFSPAVLKGDEPVLVDVKVYNVDKSCSWDRNTNIFTMLVKSDSGTAEKRFQKDADIRIWYELVNKDGKIEKILVEEAVLAKSLSDHVSKLLAQAEEQPVIQADDRGNAGPDRRAHNSSRSHPYARAAKIATTAALGAAAAATAASLGVPGLAIDTGVATLAIMGAEAAHVCSIQ